MNKRFDFCSTYLTARCFRSKYDRNISGHYLSGSRVIRMKDSQNDEAAREEGKFRRRTDKSEVLSQDASLLVPNKLFADIIFN